MTLSSDKPKCLGDGEKGCKTMEDGDGHDIEMMEWTLYWCLVSTSFFGLRLTAWTCERAHPKPYPPYPRYERKLLQYKSRVEAELQQASGRESELEIKLKAKNQDRSMAEATDQISILRYLATGMRSPWSRVLEDQRSTREGPCPPGG